MGSEMCIRDRHIEDFGKQYIDLPFHSVNLFPSHESFTIETENDY